MFSTYFKFDIFIISRGCLLHVCIWFRIYMHMHLNFRSSINALRNFRSVIIFQKLSICRFRIFQEQTIDNPDDSEQMNDDRPPSTKQVFQRIFQMISVSYANIGKLSWNIKIGLPTLNFSPIVKKIQYNYEK